MQGPESPLSILIEEANHLAILRHVRAHKVSNSSLVVKHGQILLQSKGWYSNLSDIERLASLEQICIAALEEQNTELAKEILDKIQKEVIVLTPADDNSGKPNVSLRYRKLIALSFECEDNYEKALKLYGEMIRENPANSYALKRRYCILKCQGKGEEAREALNSYLEGNGTDACAWMEMANSCLEVGDYTGAAYCYEEIVLSSPMDAKVHCMLGEIYVTIGGFENLKLARKHLALSLELDSKNLRAIYGIVGAAETYLEICKSNVENKAGGNNKKKKRNEFDEEDVEMARDLYEYGIGRLSKSYKGTHMGSLIEIILGDSQD